jgi:hypothetical protein
MDGWVVPGKYKEASRRGEDLWSPAKYRVVVVAEKSGSKTAALQMREYVSGESVDSAEAGEVEVDGDGVALGRGDFDGGGV